MQTVIDWAYMDGYGKYVWSVFAVLVVAITYEIGSLKLAERRSNQMSEFKL